MAAAADSKSAVREDVRVRVPPPAPLRMRTERGFVWFGWQRMRFAVVGFYGNEFAVIRNMFMSLIVPTESDI